MTWRLAKSLVTLRSEVNAFAPNRSKASDGTIGDPAHASRASRHNPNVEGVVTALDITHDPAGGCDIHLIARALVAKLRAGGTSNPDFEYVISNQQKASRSGGWNWVTYTGSNPHTKHAHFAVGRGPDSAPAFPYDDTILWGIAELFAPAQPQPSPTPAPTPQEEDMAAIVRGDQSDEWWVLTAMSKRWIPTAGHAQFLQNVVKQAQGADANASPWVIPQSYVNEMPTIVTEDWLRSLMGGLLDAQSATDRASILDAINSHNPTVTVTDAQIAKISAALKADLDKLKGLSDADKAAVAQLTAKAVIAEIAS